MSGLAASSTVTLGQYKNKCSKYWQCSFDFLPLEPPFG